MRRISIVNFKGGTGKSSLTENLAYELAQSGYRVLVIDCDRQCNSSVTLLGGALEPPTLTQVLTGVIPLDKAVHPSPKSENLFVVPAGRDLNDAVSYIIGKRTAYYALAKATKELSYDFIFYDHAGALTVVMEVALLASDEMLIPCTLEAYAVQGLFDMFQKLGETLSDHEIRNSGIIPYNVNMKYGMTRGYLKELHDTEDFRDLLLPMIRTDSSVPIAQSNQETIFELEKRERIHSRAASDYRDLAKDLIEMGGIQ